MQKNATNNIGGTSWVTTRENLGEARGAADSSGNLPADSAVCLFLPLPNKQKPAAPTTGTMMPQPTWPQTNASTAKWSEHWQHEDANASGTFRAAVFGANDGLVSNLALILGVGASGVSHSYILLAGLSGLLAGALSMGAGEFVSVRSQRELLDAENPSPHAHRAIGDLDVNANELALVYRARGMNETDAHAHAELVLSNYSETTRLAEDIDADKHETLGTAWGAAGSSFAFFASGAIIPLVPYLFGIDGYAAMAVAVSLTGLALCATGAAVGVLSGASPLRRAARQLAIGLGAALATYALGLIFGVTVG